MPVLQLKNQQQTTMGQAFEEAGMAHPDQTGEANARKLAHQAWDRWPDDHKQRRLHFNWLLAPQGASFMMKSIDPATWVAVVGRFLNMIGDERKRDAAKDKAAGAPGPTEDRNPECGRSGVAPYDSKAVDVELQAVIDDYSASSAGADAAKVAEPAAIEPELRTRSDFATDAKNEVLLHKSFLDTILIGGGIPLYQAHRKQSLDWADLEEHDGRGLLKDARRIEKDGIDQLVKAIVIRKVWSGTEEGQPLSHYWPDKEHPDLKRIYEAAGKEAVEMARTYRHAA
jgi:hypothetical protein